MRIITGLYKGKKLAFSVMEGLRPTKGRIRENIFNLLSGGQPEFFQGKSVGDAFAGTGALGLEALSRGAKSVVFIEQSPEALKLLRATLKSLGGNPPVTLLATKAQRALASPCKEPLDILFLDPPYGFLEWQELLHLANEKGWIQTSTLLVMEQDQKDPPLTNIQILKEKVYGRCRVTIAQFKNLLTVAEET